MRRLKDILAWAAVILTMLLAPFASGPRSAAAAQGAELTSADDGTFVWNVESAPAR
jgi:hypothetical protein